MNRFFAIASSITVALIPAISAVSVGFSAPIEAKAAPKNFNLRKYNQIKMKPFPKLKQIKSRQEPMYQHGYVGGSYHDDLWFRETHYPGIRPVIRHDKHYGPTVYMPPQQETFNDSTSDCKVMWLTPLTAKIDC